MLCIALAAAAGVHLLAPQATGPLDESLVPAVYSYRSGAMPDCGQLSGRQSPSTPARELEWVRLGGLGPSAPAAADGKCLGEPIAL